MAAMRPSVVLGFISAENCLLIFALVWFSLAGWPAESLVGLNRIRRYALLRASPSRTPLTNSVFNLIDKAGQRRIVGLDYTLPLTRILYLEPRPICAAHLTD
jgi:hypothetical protein